MVDTESRCPKCGEVLKIKASEARLICESCGLALFEFIELAGISL